MTAARDPRNVQLGRIHQAKKALALDEGTYRALLQRVGGQASSADMTTEQRNAVLAEFVRLGFKADRQQTRKRRWPGEPNNCDDVPMLRKVRALLADSKRPWSYAHAMAKRMFHVEKVEWLHADQQHKLVAALQADANRRAG